MDKAINFFFSTQGITLRNRNKLKQFIRNRLLRSGKKLNYLNYIFCSDEYLLDINRRYLKHDFLTDIITFNLSDQPGFIEGEIYISLERVRENAATQATTLTEELLRVIFHGVLHLLGYSDINLEQKAEMRSQENRWISDYKRYVPREMK